MDSFSFPSFYATILLKEDATMKSDIEDLRNKYIKNPPEGMTPRDIRQMSESDLLDMDYFLHEFDDDDDDWGTEGFYIF